MSTHHGYLKEFPFLRVDCFDARTNPYHNPLDEYATAEPTAYLLTHAHTDHVKGLESPNFRGTIYCTETTKAIIINSMSASDRVVVYESQGGVCPANIAPRRKYPHLRAGGTGATQIRTQLINVPFEVRGPNQEIIKVTAIDANHCPGACMFLVEGIYQNTFRAVIVTGDIRAEPAFVEGLTHNEALKPYLKTAVEDFHEGGLFPRLDCIYLDTSAVGDPSVLPTKVDAAAGLVKIVRRYPPESRFFINAWTYGYEDVLTSIATALDTQIHVDWFKHQLYTTPEFRKHYPLLGKLATLSEAPMRWHACERRWKCDQVFGNGVGCYVFEAQDLPRLHSAKRKKIVGGEGGDLEEENLVRINPQGLTQSEMDKYYAQIHSVIDSVEQTKSHSGGIQVPGLTDTSRGGESARLSSYLSVPIHRHSTQPELVHFVSIFRPASLYPLTVSPDSRGGEYDVLLKVFTKFLPPNLTRDHEWTWLANSQLAEIKRLLVAQVGKLPARERCHDEDDNEAGPCIYAGGGESSRQMSIEVDNFDGVMRDSVFIWQGELVGKSASLPAALKRLDRSVPRRPLESAHRPPPLPRGIPRPSPPLYTSSNNLATSPHSYRSRPPGRAVATFALGSGGSRVTKTVVPRSPSTKAADMTTTISGASTSQLRRSSKPFTPCVNANPTCPAYYRPPPVLEPAAAAAPPNSFLAPLLPVLASVLDPVVKRSSSVTSTGSGEKKPRVKQRVKLTPFWSERVAVALASPVVPSLPN